MAKSSKSVEDDGLPPFDAQELLQYLGQPSLGKRNKHSDEAQDLFYDAMTARTPEEHIELLAQTLDLDPGNVDAWRVTVGYYPLTPNEEVEVLRRLVSIAERRLGQKVFKELAGEFWGFFETRPYMRVRGDLALSLHEAGRVEEAIVEWEAMLELNPGDNQGMRYMLLASYLALSRLEDARKLFSQYDECDFNTVFAYCRVLERFLSGDEAGAVTALAAARKQNPYSGNWLRDFRRRPHSMPGSNAPGSKEEAMCYANTLHTAWARHAGARKWLAGQAPKPKKKGG